jgi:hypothetical protein
VLNPRIWERVVEKRKKIRKGDTKKVDEEKDEEKKSEEQNREERHFYLINSYSFVSPFRTSSKQKHARKNVKVRMLH